MLKSRNLGRRPLLAGAAGICAAGRGRPAAAQSGSAPAGGTESLIARKEMAVQVIDFGWRRDPQMFDTAGPGGAVTNEIYTLETHARYVRFRFQNGLENSWTIAGATYAPTAVAQNDPVDASGASVPLRPVTFGNNGLDVALADQRAGGSAPTSLVLPPASQGKAFPAHGYLFHGVPNIVFSDWMPLDLVARTDGFPGALVMLRAWTPSAVFTGIRPTRVFQNGLFQGTPARPWRTSFVAVEGDASALLTQTGAADAAELNLGNGLCCGVQAIGDVPGLTLLSVGDSALMGGGEAQGYLGPIKRAADLMSSADLPVSHIESAIYGCPSQAFCKAGKLAVMTNKVSCAFIQCLSGNDPHTVEAAQQSVARAVALADFCRGAGTLAVLLSPGPPPADDKPGKAESRAYAMDALHQLQGQGYTVLDLVPVLSDGGGDENAMELREDLRAGDNVHLNSEGDTLYANAVIALLRRCQLVDG